MQILCDREKLASAFRLAAGAAPSRSPRPILQNVKIDAWSGGVVLMGTDLEVGVRVDVSGVSMDAPGAALLPADRFGSILSEDESGKILIEAGDRKIIVRGDRSEYRLPAADADEFPDVAGFSAEQYHELSATFFREMIKRTIFACDATSAHYALGGVLLEVSGGELTAVATDGRRLAKQTGPVTGDAEAPGKQTVVPERAMRLMARAIGDGEGDARLAFRDNDVVVRTERLTMRARLLEGRFPKWRDVFPDTGAMTKIDMSAGAFLRAVRQAAIVTTQKKVGVEFAFGDGKVTLGAEVAETGKSRVEMPIAHDGDAISVILNPHYLADFLDVLGPDSTFVLGVKDADTAVVCDTEDDYQYVLMPLSAS